MVFMITCKTCALLKPPEDFNICNKAKNTRQSSCRECKKKYNRQQYLKDPDRKKYKSLDGRSKALFNQAKSRAKERNLEFNITLQYVYVLLFLGKCQKSGISFDFNSNISGFRNPFAPSIDRKDSCKGYTLDNVQIVCNMYNIGKGQHTDDEFIRFCKKVAEYNK